MATPAAILSILVKAEGIAGVSRSLTTVNEELVATNVQGAKAEKRLLGVGAAGKTAGTGLMGAAKHAAGFAAAYAGFRGIEKSIQTTEDLGKSALTLSRSFGMAADSASRWAAVMQARGVEGTKTTMGFKTLATQVRNAANGSKDAVKTFRELGISQKELARAGGDLQQVLSMVSDGLGQMPGGTEKAAIQSRLFGRTWLALSPLLRDGSAAMNEQLKVSDKYGATLGGKGVKAIQDTIRAQREAKLASIGLQIALGQTLLPVVDKVVEGFAHFVAAFRAGTGTAGMFRNAINAILGRLQPFGESIQQIVGFLKQHEQIAQPLIGILLSLAAAQAAVNIAMNANPVIKFVAVMALLTTAIVTAYRESTTFRNIVDGIFQWLQSASPTAIAVATAAFNALRVAIQAIGVAAQAVFPVLMTAATAAATAIGTAFTATVGALTTATQATVHEVSQWTVLWNLISAGATLMVSIVKTQLAILTVAFRVAMLALAPIATAAWKLVEGIFGAAFAAIKGIVTGGLQVIHGVIQIFGGLFKGDFSQMWDGVKSIFRGGLTALRGILDGAWKMLKAPVDAIATGLHTVFANSWDRIKTLFRDSINAVIQFLNSMISAVNVVLKVVGAKQIGAIGKIGGGGGGGGGTPEKPAPHGGAFAHGGAYARTRGVVNRPITLMGEEAPRHPEYVIPTNPAYRDRAKGLLAQAAGAIGFQAGGRWGVNALEHLWTSAGGGKSLAHTMAIIATAESGSVGQYGYQYAHNPSGATGLWQILGSLVPGDLYNAMVNAKNAVAKFQAQGLGAWVSSKPMWGPLVGNFPGNKQGGGLGIDPLSMLPKVTDKLGMFKDLGSYVLDKTTGWVKDKIGGLFTGGPSGGPPAGPGATATGPKGVGSFMGVPMANWVIESLRYAQSKGVQVRPTSGYRPGFDPHTATGRSEHQGTQYPHGAVDFGGYHDAAALAMKMAVVHATAGFKYPLVAPIGFIDDGHASGTGHRRGGIFGGLRGLRRGGKFQYLGSFAKGGVTRSEGMAHLHKNEAILPLKKGGRNAANRSPSKQGVVTRGRNVIARSAPMKKFKLPPIKWPKLPAPVADPQDQGPVDPGPTQLDYINAAMAQARLTASTADDLQTMQQLQQFRLADYNAAVAGGDPRAIAETAGALADVNSSLDQLNESITHANQIAEERAALEKQVAANQLKILALAGQGDQILGAVIAAVNGGIGGRVGLGFQTPSYPGGVARY